MTSKDTGTSKTNEDVCFLYIITYLWSDSNATSLAVEEDLKIENFKFSIESRLTRRCLICPVVSDVCDDG